MEPLLRTICFFIDKILYGFIPTIYNFIMTLARANIFEPEKIEKLANNIYAILGLYMVFRLAFILLTSIIDPEKLTDKNAGLGKIASRFIVALLLIVIIPWGFTMARAVQNSVLDNRVIQKLFLGTGDINGNAGAQMGKISLQSFLSLHPEVTRGSSPWNNYQAGFEDAFPVTPDPNTGKLPTANFDVLTNTLNEKFDASTGRTFAYEYKYGISTICGGLILFMLATLCIDVAVRVVKLAFMQVMTPVAVVGYIEPKAKNDVFNKWLKTTIKVYINLFIRIVAISFITYTMSAISLNLTFDGIEVDNTTKLFAQIFIIIGLLIFAKELPKILGELFDLKEGNILNPFKRMKDMAVGGNIIPGAAGLAGSLAFGGLGRGLGALGGGTLSKIRGGTFGAGAKAGARAVGKKIPIGPKFSGKQIGGALLGGFTGMGAGWGSAKDAPEHRKNLRLDKKAMRLSKESYDGDKLIKTADPSMFSKSDVSNAFKTMQRADADLKGSKRSLSSAQRVYEQNQQAYNSASGRFNAVQGDYDHKKSEFEQAKAQWEQVNSRLNSYTPGSADYNSYMVSADYRNAQNNYNQTNSAYTAAGQDFETVKSELEFSSASLQSSLHSVQEMSDEVDSAEKTLKKSEAQLTNILSDPRRAKDKKKYEHYKGLKDRGVITR